VFVCLCSSAEEEYVQALQQQMAEITLREEEVGGGADWLRAGSRVATLFGWV